MSSISAAANTHVPHEVSKTMQEVTQERKKRVRATVNLLCINEICTLWV